MREFSRSECGPDITHKTNISGQQRALQASSRPSMDRAGFGWRHDGCGGRAGRAELLTSVDGASSRPVRKIVLMGGN